jgi:cyclopropane fatty-acyl-phospholipid synthase-like methyltransferase
MSKIPYFKDTWKYFSTIHPTICDDRILDYGSNYGCFLESSKGAYNPSNYTGIDVDLDSLEEGKKRYPAATFIHSNAYNVMYNHNGIINLKPTLKDKFDSIISYSVLTHTTYDDFFSTIDWLYSLLNNYGTMMITFLDIDDKKTTNFFYQKRIRDYGKCDTISSKDWTYLIDTTISKIEKNADHFLLFFNKEFLLENLKAYKVEIIPAPINAKGCFQTCLVIKK